MILVLTGTNELEKLQALQRQIGEFKKKYGGSIEYFDGSELESTDSIIDAVRSISFLDPRKLVVVRSIDKSKDLLEQCNELVSQTADSTDLILEGTIDKRTSLFKSLKKVADFREFREHDLQELNRWCKAYVDDNGGETSLAAMHHIVSVIGGDQLRLKSELDKLLLTNKPITIELIDEMVEPKAQSKIFTMLDELFRGNSEKAWELYLDQRAQGQEPQKIIAMLTWQLQQLAQAVYSKEKSVAALQSLGMSPFAAQKSLQMTRTVSKRQMKFYIDTLAEIDYMSKTNASVEPALAVYFSELAISS